MYRALKILQIIKGGPGSGNWGHVGRIGHRGGSQSNKKVMSISGGRDAKRRQNVAKDSQFFRGNIKTSSLEQIYKGSSPEIQKLARETGVLATDPESLAYVRTNKDKFLQFSKEDIDDLGIKIAKKKVSDKTKVLDTYFKVLANYDNESISDFSFTLGTVYTFVDNFGDDLIRFELNDKITSTALQEHLTDSEKAVVAKVAKLRTKNNHLDGKKAQKAIENLSPAEKDAITSAAYKAMLMRGASSLSLVNAKEGRVLDYHEKLEALDKAIKDIGFPKIDRSNHLNSTQKFYDSLLDHLVKTGNIIEPEDLDRFYSTDNMIALASASKQERQTQIQNLDGTFDHSTHHFKATVNNVFYIKNSGKVEKNFQRAVMEYGNVQSNLYHGTHIQVARLIGANGYIVPKEAKTGRMLGDGVYLAKNSSKSIQYLGSNFGHYSTRGVLFSNQAAMGVKADWHDSILKKSQADTIEALKGSKYSSYSNKSLRNTEWAVKDPEAVIPRYWIDVTRKK